MRRLIDADALHDALRAKQKWIVHNGDKHNEGYTYDQVHFAIDDAPTIDPVKHGYWDEKYVENADIFFRRRFYCSACGEWQTYGKTHYCPNCGAKMDEEVEE